MTMAEDFFRNLLEFLRRGGGDRPEKKALHGFASDRNMDDTYLLHSYGRFSNRKSDRREFDAEDTKSTEKIQAASLLLRASASFVFSVQSLFSWKQC
jgi:hypothetical protein